MLIISLEGRLFSYSYFISANLRSGKIQNGFELVLNYYVNVKNQINGERERSGVW